MRDWQKYLNKFRRMDSIKSVPMSDLKRVVDAEDATVDDRADAYELMADLVYEKGMVDSAVKYYEKSFDIRPDEDLKTLIASTLCNGGVKKAIEVLNSTKLKKLNIHELTHYWIEYLGVACMSGETDLIKWVLKQISKNKILTKELDKSIAYTKEYLNLIEKYYGAQ